MTPPPPPPPQPVLSVTSTNVSDFSTSTAITGTSGADLLVGGAGNDTLSGGAGDDILQGDGAGSVTVPLSISASLANVADPGAFSVAIAGVPQGATLSAGIDNGNGTWTLASSQLSGLSITAPDSADFTLQITATATDGSTSAQSQLAVTLAGGDADMLDGGDGNDTIDGGAGNDVIIDGAGSDVAWGGDGNDLFQAGAGSDIYEGGNGFDTIDFSAAAELAGSGLFVDMAAGTVKDVATGVTDAMNGIEKFVASVGNDLIFGDAAADIIDASAGDDVLVGGTGSDTLTGGQGNDLFLLRDVDILSGNVDTITDLQVGDMIVLDGVMPVSLVDDGQSSTLYADVNGQNVAVLELAGLTGYTIDDLYTFGILS